MEVPRLGVKSELQLLAYATATATPDLDHICDSTPQLMATPDLNPLNEARGWTHILMDTSQPNWATTGTLLFLSHPSDNFFLE